MSRTKTAQNFLPLAAYSLDELWLVLKVIPRKTNDNSSRLTAKGELRNSCSVSVRIGFMGLDQQHSPFYSPLPQGSECWEGIRWGEFREYQRLTQGNQSGLKEHQRTTEMKAIDNE